MRSSLQLAEGQPFATRVAFCRYRWLMGPAHIDTHFHKKEDTLSAHKDCYEERTAGFS